MQIIDDFSRLVTDLTAKERLFLLIRIILALLLAPFTSWTYDVYVFFDAGVGVLYGQGLYGRNIYSYPPLWAFIYMPLLELVSLFFPPNSLASLDTRLADVSASTGMVNAYVTAPLFNLILKLPLLIADVLVALYIRKVVAEHHSKESAFAAFCLWVCNPITFVVSFMQGQFDLLPGIALVLSAIALSRKEYVISGIWIAIGTLLKVFPAYLIPLYLVAIVRSEFVRDQTKTLLRDFTSKIRSLMRPLLMFMVGGLAVAAIFILPALDFLSILRYRVETAYTGGVTIWTFQVLPWLNGGQSSGLPDTSGLQVYSSFLEIAVLCAIALIAFIASDSFDLNKILKYQVISVAAIFLLSPLVQPQYICWLVPSAILLTGLTGRYGARTLVLSGLATLFIFSLLTINAFFYPLAVYVGTPSPEYLNSLILAYWNSGLALRSYLLFIGGFGGALVIITFLIPNKYLPRATDFRLVARMRSLVDKTGPATIDHGELPHPGRSSLLVALLIALMVLGQLVSLPLLHSQTEPSSELGSHYLNQGSRTLSVNVTLDSGIYTNTVNAFACAVTSDEFPNRMYVYYDESYPTNMTRKAGLPALRDHLQTYIESSGENISVDNIDAQGLLTVVQSTVPSILVIATGVLPDIVFGNYTDLVGPWLRNGGILFWAGAPIGLAVGHSVDSAEGFTITPVPDGQQSLIGYSVTTTNEYVHPSSYSPSPLSSALGLRYNLIMTGTSLDVVQMHTGLVLGAIDTTPSGEQRTSISAFQVGSGHLVIFGGGITNSFGLTAEDALASDISRILCSHVLFLEDDFSHTELNIAAQTVSQLAMTLTLAGSGPWLVYVMVFQDRPFPRYLGVYSLEVS